MVGAEAGGGPAATPRNSDLSALEARFDAVPGRRPAPVERWNPPYCGDIGMAILADGTWHYRGSPIARPALVKLFASVLRRDADGRHYLVTPVEKVDVAVADAPFLAVELEVGGQGADQRLAFRTNVDDVVVAGVDHPLRFAIEPGTGGIKPYVLVRGRLEALVCRSVTHDLLALVEDGDGRAAGAREAAGGRTTGAGPDAAARERTSAVASSGSGEAGFGIWSGGCFFPVPE
ncbi:MAG: DUF1285 domain-containing protein [Hyphomicrobiaceae bacterium]|nr:DUF1285 domain-containing protein [Hyphomicrobiaceae bacterium]